MDRDTSLRIIDYVLTGIVITPAIIEKVANLIRLRQRIKDGETITVEDIDAALKPMDERSGRIQSA